MTAPASEDSNDCNDLEVAAVLANAADDRIDGKVNDKTVGSCASNDNQDFSPFKTATALDLQSVTTDAVPPIVIEPKSPASSAAETHNICRLAARGELQLLRQIVNDDNINVRDGSGRTPLFCAVDAGWSHVVLFLLTRRAVSATMTMTDERGATVLMHAAALGRRSLIDLLLTHGADVNATCHKGNTALHYAVFGNHLDSVRLLLESGADMTVGNSDGLTPDVLASRLGYLTVQDTIYAYVLGALSGAHG